MAENKTLKIMEEPLPQILQELEKSIEEARAAARDARKAADEAKEAGQTVPKELIQRIITSKTFLSFILVLVLATIMAAVLFSVGLATILP